MLTENERFWKINEMVSIPAQEVTGTISATPTGTERTSVLKVLADALRALDLPKNPTADDVMKALEGVPADVRARLLTAWRCPARHPTEELRTVLQARLDDGLAALFRDLGLPLDPTPQQVLAAIADSGNRRRAAPAARAAARRGLRRRPRASFWRRSSACSAPPPSRAIAIDINLPQVTVKADPGLRLDLSAAASRTPTAPATSRSRSR